MWFTDELRFLWISLSVKLIMARKLQNFCSRFSKTWIHFLSLKFFVAFLSAHKTTTIVFWPCYGKILNANELTVQRSCNEKLLKLFCCCFRVWKACLDLIKLTPEFVHSISIFLSFQENSFERQEKFVKLFTTFKQNCNISP